MKNLNLTLKVRLISNFFQEIITTAFLPFIALYLSDLVSVKFSGIFLSILVILNFPVALLGGYLIEIFPKKKSVLIYQLIMAISLILMAISLLNSYQNITLFCVSYSIFSITWGLQYSAMDTIIMDAITPDVENYVFKIDYWLTNVAVAFGAFLGGILYSANHSIVILMASLVFFLVYLALWKWIKKDSNALEIKKKHISFLNICHSYKDVLKDKQYVILSISFSIIMMAELSTSSYVAIRLKESFNDTMIFSFLIDGVKMYSTLMIVNTIIVVVFTYMVIKYTSFLNEKARLIIGLSFYVIGYSNIIYLNHLLPLILFMIIATIGEIVYAPIFDEKKYKMIPENKRGTYSGLNNLGYNISELLARFGIVLGTILSPLSMFIYTFVILSLGAMLMYYSIYYSIGTKKSLSTSRGENYYK
ncbi:MFS transporter [Bacillus mycoides]|uniref:MDR family MFS transporter n=1 Tax=Bacillus mycoides TaxID=1405 RepID=UPI003D1DC31D